VLWQERLGGNFSASPFAAGGLVYAQSEDGTATIIEPGPQFKVVAKNSLDPSTEELFRGSLTPCSGQIFARSDKMLYCIGRKPPTAGGN
jgi:outer membrane protein assembly factor BamB